MLRLKQMRVDGFRGFPKQSDLFEFGTPAILVNGDNHQGKSSILNAIEWCLYGDQCVGEKSGIRERVGSWEIVNRNASSASVTLELESEAGTITINRVETKGKGKKGKRIEVILPDKSKKEGPEAEQFAANLVGMSFRDFATTVYQHQETIRDIVIQKPADRNEAIDRLLGLSDYRNILDGIKKSKVADIHKELLTQLEAFQECINRALKYCRDDLETKRQKAITRGLVETDLSEEKLLQRAVNIGTQMTEFSSALGIPPTPISSPSTWREIYQYRDAAKKELERLWRESPDVKEQATLNSRRSGASSVRANYESSKNTCAIQKETLEAMERDSGNLAKIEDQILELGRTIESVEHEIATLNPRANLVVEAINLLESAISGNPSSVCPICGKSDPGLLEHLKKEWTEEIETQVRAFRVQQTQLATQKADWEQKKTDYTNLKRNVEAAAVALAKTTGKASEFLAKPLTEQDDPIALLNKEIESIDQRLIEIGTAITEKRETLGRISDALETIILACDILENAEKIADIQKIDQTDEYRELGEIRDAMAEFVEDVEYLDKTVRECLTEEAKGRIGAAGDAIDSYFRKITANPAIRKLKVQVEEDKKTGGNSYAFCDQDEQELSPILSQGDLNSLALSMFLGLVKGYAHPVGFILMDDPSQSLGPAQKERLVEVLDEVCQTGRTIVLGIMDTELQQLLETNLTRAKTVYEISKWTPESGPVVSKKA